MAITWSTDVVSFPLGRFSTTMYLHQVSISKNDWKCQYIIMFSQNISAQKWFSIEQFFFLSTDLNLGDCHLVPVDDLQSREKGKDYVRASQLWLFAGLRDLTFVNHGDTAVFHSVNKHNIARLFNIWASFIIYILHTEYPQEQSLELSVLLMKNVWDLGDGESILASIMASFIIDNKSLSVPSMTQITDVTWPRWVSSILLYKMHPILKPKCFSSRLVVVFVQYIEAKC